MDDKLLTQLKILKLTNSKPNFSELEGSMLLIDVLLKSIMTDT